MLVQLDWVPCWPCPGQWDTLHPMQTSVLPLASQVTSPTPGCYVDPSTPTQLPWKRGASPNTGVPAGPPRSTTTITMLDSSHPAQPSALVPSSPQGAGVRAQPSAEDASTLGCNAAAPGGEAGAMCMGSCGTSPRGAAGPVGPSEMGPGCIFPGAIQQERQPATDKLDAQRGCQAPGGPYPCRSRMGWASASYSCPAPKWDGRQLIYLLRKDKQHPGALQGRELPCSPGKGAHFSRRASLARMLCYAGCCQAAWSSRSPRGSPAPGQDEGQFLRRHLRESQRAQKRWLFPAEGCSEGDRGSARAVESQREASSYFHKMLQGKGRIWLMLAAPGPCSMQVALEGTEPAALGTQSSCHPMLPTPSAAAGGLGDKLLWQWHGAKATVPCVPMSQDGAAACPPGIRESLAAALAKKSPGKSKHLTCLLPKLPP